MEAKVINDKDESHHIWCNFFMKPRKDCKMCDRLFEKYPYNGVTSLDELVVKYFPNVKCIR